MNELRLARLKETIEKINNVAPEMVERLINHFSENSKTPNAGNLMAFMKSIYEDATGQKLMATTARSPAYWVFRGWSKSEASINARRRTMEFKREHTVMLSPFSREFWMAKINPSTNRLYTIEEADFERNSRRPIRKEYWAVKGFSLTVAQQKASAAKDMNNRKGATSPKNANWGSTKKVGYWIARGYTGEEAALIISQSQSTFSLKKCIETYGREEGTQRFNMRQEKWLASFYNKSEEEIADIIRRRTIGGGNKSGLSQDLFKKIHREGARWGQEDSLGAGEFYVRLPGTKSGYLIDFCIGGKAIEFFGDYWHANPQVYNPGTILSYPFGECSVEDVNARDAERMRKLQQLGFETLIVWENDYRNNPDTVIKKCNEFLNESTRSNNAEVH